MPLDESDRHRLSMRFTVDFNYNSNHIEGNTLTYGQTELLLIFGKVMGEGELKDYNDMKASDVGLKLMEVESLTKDMPLTQNFIRQLHKTLLREDYKVYRKLPGGEYTSYIVHAGQYKTRPNSVITRTGERFEYASPEETPALMTDLIDWYNEEESKGEINAVDLAALFHYRYIRIHPFEDGNGRIARLLVNFILARHNYPMIVVRSRKKYEYLDALSMSDKIVGILPSKGAKATLDEIRHFRRYFTNLVNEEMQADIEFITDKRENVWWYDGEKIEFLTSSAPIILKSLMLDPAISNKSLAENADISIRSVNKQIKSLLEKKYIEKTTDGYRVFITPSVP
ncbi:Fic family protein [Lepagella muris]|jgi:Fic family protein|uniref:Fic family protein n=1 Tax=Lepagella muris TaxID=3032870 RepID=UPI0023B8521D|nr:Fic family protein [Lepagella muris]